MRSLLVSWRPPHRSQSIGRAAFGRGRYGTCSRRWQARPRPSTEGLTGPRRAVRCAHEAETSWSSRRDCEPRHPASKAACGAFQFAKPRRHGQEDRYRGRSWARSWPRRAFRVKGRTQSTKFGLRFQFRESARIPATALVAGVHLTVETDYLRDRASHANLLRDPPSVQPRPENGPPGGPVARIVDPEVRKYWMGARSGNSSWRGSASGGCWHPYISIFFPATTNCGLVAYNYISTAMTLKNQALLHV